MTGTPEESAGVETSEARAQAAAKLIEYFAGGGLRTLLLVNKDLRLLLPRHQELAGRSYELSVLIERVETTLTEAGYTEKEIEQLPKSVLKSN
jgi:hypothetical protein